MQAGAFATALRLLAAAAPGCLTSAGRPGRTCCAGTSRSPREIVMRPNCCCTERDGIEPLDLKLARETYAEGVGRGGDQSASLRQRQLADIAATAGAAGAGERRIARTDTRWAVPCYVTEGVAAAVETLRRAAAALTAGTRDDLLWLGGRASRAGRSGTRSCLTPWRLARSMSPATPARWTGCRSASRSVRGHGGQGRSRRRLIDRRGDRQRDGGHRPPSAPRRGRHRGRIQGGEAATAAADNHQARARDGDSRGAWARWAAAVLYNGLARFEDALSAAAQAMTSPMRPVFGHVLAPRAGGGGRARRERARPPRRRSSESRRRRRPERDRLGRSASRRGAGRCWPRATLRSGTIRMRSNGWVARG